MVKYWKYHRKVAVLACHFDKFCRRSHSERAVKQLCSLTKLTSIWPLHWLETMLGMLHSTAHKTPRNFVSKFPLIWIVWFHNTDNFEEMGLYDCFSDSVSRTITGSPSVILCVLFHWFHYLALRTFHRMFHLLGLLRVFHQEHSLRPIVEVLLQGNFSKPPRSRGWEVERAVSLLDLIRHFFAYSDTGSLWIGHRCVLIYAWMNFGLRLWHVWKRTRLTF
jgi:hypothetical protein